MDDQHNIPKTEVQAQETSPEVKERENPIYTIFNNDDIGVLTKASVDIKTKEELDEVVTKLKAGIQPMADHALGLAAPQVGVNKNVFIITERNGDYVNYKVVVNPKIIGHSGGHQKKSEGCFSLPGHDFLVKRPRKVTAKYLNEDLEEVMETFEGKAARVFCHEYHHLHGIMIHEIGKLLR